MGSGEGGDGDELGSGGATVVGVEDGGTSVVVGSHTELLLMVCEWEVVGPVRSLSKKESSCKGSVVSEMEGVMLDSSNRTSLLINIERVYGL